MCATPTDARLITDPECSTYGREDLEADTALLDLLPLLELAGRVARESCAPVRSIVSSASRGHSPSARMSRTEMPRLSNPPRSAAARVSGEAGKSEPESGSIPKRPGLTRRRQASAGRLAFRSASISLRLRDLHPVELGRATRVAIDDPPGVALVARSGRVCEREIAVGEQVRFRLPRSLAVISQDSTAQEAGMFSSFDK